MTDPLEQRSFPAPTSTRKLVKWRCYKCNCSGIVPELHDKKAEPMVSAIERGHERKADGCHAKRGVREIMVEYNGMSIDVPTFTLLYRGNP